MAESTIHSSEFDVRSDLLARSRLFLQFLDAVVNHDQGTRRENSSLNAEDLLPFINDLGVYESLKLPWRKRDNLDGFKALASHSRGTFKIDEHTRGGILLEDTHTALVFIDLAYSFCKERNGHQVDKNKRHRSSDIISHELDHAIAAGQWGALNSPQHADKTKIGLILKRDLFSGELTPQFYYPHREYTGLGQKVSDAISQLNLLFQRNPKMTESVGAPTDADYIDRNADLAYWYQLSNALLNFNNTLRICIVRPVRNISNFELQHVRNMPAVSRILDMTEMQFMQNYINVSGNPRHNKDVRSFQVIEGLTALALRSAAEGNQVLMWKCCLVTIFNVMLPPQRTKHIVRNMGKGKEAIGFPHPPHFQRQKYLLDSLDLFEGEQNINFQLLIMNAINNSVNVILDEVESTKFLKERLDNTTDSRSYTQRLELTFNEFRSIIVSRSIASDNESWIKAKNDLDNLLLEYESATRKHKG